MKYYDEQLLKNSLEANHGRPYQQCSISVMDTIADSDITFDSEGVCNYYYEYKKAEESQTLTGEEGRVAQKHLANKIITSQKRGKYNCILGLSGGADSSYLAYLAKQLGLTPLLVHFDYGWNSETATINVENTVKNTGFDLFTVVMDWPEFKSLQRSYFKASVLDLDVPADHMIFGALYKMALKFNIKYILSGNNVWTEHTLPRSWNYNKFDLVNLKNIHRTFENKPLKKLPALGVWQQAYYQLIFNIQRVNFLDLQEYNRSNIIKTIEDQLNWKNYGWKHHESIFTRFYQGYILPIKFNIDKRKPHLSNLIFSGQLTKQEALLELQNPAYPLALQKEDFEFVAKKLDFSLSDFEEILNLSNVKHSFYGTDESQRNFYFSLMRKIKPLTQILKPILRK